MQLQSRKICSNIDNRAPRSCRVSKPVLSIVDVGTNNQRRALPVVRSGSEDQDAPATASTDPVKPPPPAATAKAKKLPGGSVNLFDPAATASRFLTRRFGIVGGLGLVALLASTEGWEIIKAALEKDVDVVNGELVTLPSGLSYRDIKVGGGRSPNQGDFIGAHMLVRQQGADGVATGDAFLDTRAAGSKPLAFSLGRKPYQSVMCAGVEEGVSTMRRGGVRELLVPPKLAFGAEGRLLAVGLKIPPGAALSYVISLEDVSPSYL